MRLLASLLLLASVSVQAQTYPNKQIGRAHV